MNRSQRLTEMQESFVAHYINNGGSSYKACIDAGYSEHFANTHSHTLLKKKAIAELITESMEHIEKRLEITFLDKARKLKKIIDDVIPEDGSEPKRDYYRDALKAMDTLNRMCGHYLPQQTVNITYNATKNKLKDARKQYDEF